MIKPSVIISLLVLSTPAVSALAQESDASSASHDSHVSVSDSSSSTSSSSETESQNNPSEEGLETKEEEKNEELKQEEQALDSNESSSSSSTSSGDQGNSGDETVIEEGPSQTSSPESSDNSNGNGSSSESVATPPVSTDATSSSSETELQNNPSEKESAPKEEEEKAQEIHEVEAPKMRAFGAPLGSTLKGAGITAGASSDNTEVAEASLRSVSASAVLLNNAQDLIAISLADQIGGTSGLNGLFAAGINTSKTKTGSHVNVTGGNLAIGVSKGFNNNMSFGVFAEGGLSQFRSYVNDVKVGYGHNRYVGLGVIAHAEYKLAYVNASAHGGILKINGDFKANTNYFGGFAEVGAHLNHYIDGYMRYSYGRTGAINTEIAALNKESHFDVTNSHRVRLGMKVQLPELRFNPYMGLAVEHEFSGKTNGTVINDNVAAPSLKGNTGILELGLKHSFNKHVSGKVNIEGSIGTRRSIGGGLSLEYKF